MITPDARYRQLFNSAPCGLLALGLDGEVLNVNDTFLAWTGWSSDDMVGTNFAQFLDEGSQIFYETRHLPALRLQGEVREVALGIACADGPAMPVLVNSSVDERGILIAVFDATERQEYERDLVSARRLAESSEERVRALQDASGAFATSLSEDDVAEALAASAADAFFALGAAVTLIDESGELRIAGGSTLLLDLDSGDFAGLQETALNADGVVQVVRESDAPLAVAAAMRSARVEMMSLVALVRGGAPHGVLTCFFSRDRLLDDATLALHYALSRQASQVLARAQLQKEIERIAQHDQLTGLANRELMSQEVASAIQAADQAGTPMALLFLDLDGFKLVNDRLGHGAGDRVLREVAARLRNGVRHVDSVGRWGGDEFIAVCSDADREAAETIAERITDSIRQPIDGVPANIPVTASIGVVMYVPHERPVPTGEELLSIADDAMYAAKGQGKNRVVFVTR